MDSFEIPMWDHAFSLHVHVEGIPRNTINLLSKNKFNGESEISYSFHYLML